MSEVEILEKEELDDKVMESAVEEESAASPSSEPVPEEIADAIPDFEEPEEPYVFPSEEKPIHKFLHYKPHEEKEFSRDEWIFSQLDKEDLMEYLALEQTRSELDRQLKETREKRLFCAFQLTVSLAAVVAVVYLLRDNPTILVNILYIAGIVACLWLWKNPKDKK